MNSLAEKEENLDNNKIFKELMKNALRSGITSSKLYQYIESRRRKECFRRINTLKYTKEEFMGAYLWRKDMQKHILKY